MKNRRFTRVLSLVLSVFVAFGMLAVFTEKPEAASKYSVYVDDPVFIGQEGYASVWDNANQRTVNVTSLKSANSNILKVQKYTYYDENNKKHKGYRYTGKTAGTTKLTVCYKAGGKTKKVTKSVTVKEYPDQIVSLNVAGKNVKIEDDQRFSYYAKAKKSKTSVPVILVLKEGWTVKSVDASVSYSNGKYKKIKGAKNLLLAGKAFKFPKGTSYLNISIIMTNGTDQIDYFIGLYR